VKTRLFATDALLPDGWTRDVVIEWNDVGDIVDVRTGVTDSRDVERARGPVVPGVPNLHSHAFPRAFAGLTDQRAHADDSFWTWRDVMYRFANRIDPDALEAIATHVFVELLRGGYTSVCEFHYLHRQPNGEPYADDAAMSLALVSAAQRTGIGLTLLPVLYEGNGFGGIAPRPEQRRFVVGVDALLDLVAKLRRECASHAVRAGLAIHSLRAVSPASIDAALDRLQSIDATAPIHIHVAEQEREVEECMAWSGQRSVEWLLDHVALDARWCLVHATHMNDREVRAAARTGAVAGLCPTTEANLGDGVFDGVGWQAADGALGLGSDSNVCTDAFAEIAMLEYSQRLARKRRNVLATAAQPDVATAILLDAIAGGAQASGRPVAGIARGQRADFVVLDTSDATLAALSPAQQLATHVFARNPRAPHAVCVGGQWQVTDGHHPLEERAAQRFAEVRATLLAST
jgi:formimidoylglutamate deiminase